MITPHQIHANLLLAQNNIDRALERCGDPTRSTKLLVVTKGQPVEVINAAVAAGAKYLGENYPEETLGKFSEISGSVEWHMIGHLQRRKSQIVVEYFDYLESLDSIALAERLNRQLAEINKTLPVLIEVNISGEEGKSGFPAWDSQLFGELIRSMTEITNLPQLIIKGLMVMPPLAINPEDSRPYFKKTRDLKDILQNEFENLQLSELSMGTSSDYIVAVEEGATIVRLGTSIVGPRPNRE